MSYFLGLDPYADRGRNEGIRREVQTLRLEKRLGGHRGLRGSRFLALTKRGVRPLLRAAHLVG